MLIKKPKPSGFTIVELLIVIIVIAILATLVITAYNGVQAKVRDAKRLSDAKAIVKAIELYKADNGVLPPRQLSLIDGAPNPGWEKSWSEQPGKFLTPLIPYGFSNEVPVDPTNNSSYYYEYYVYPAGDYSCDALKGNFYVFGIKKFENMTTSQIKSPGFSCPDRNWVSEGQYVTGGFTI